LTGVIADSHFPEKSNARSTIRGLNELSWAAGFFDAEGSTVAPLERGWRRRFRVQVPQNARAGGRLVLERFLIAVGAGRIAGPDGDGLFTYYTSRSEDAIVVLRRLVPHLGPVKRTQAALAARQMLDYIATCSKPIGERSLVRRSIRDGLMELASVTAPHVAQTDEESIAWAAGTFDGDGCFRTSRSRSSPYPILSASVRQSDAHGLPHLLVRFKAVVGCGRIYGPYLRRNPNALPQYEWECRSREDVHAVYAILSPYLSLHKHRQWAEVVEKYERDREVAPARRQADRIKIKVAPQP
jgi:hypothetical protein